MNHLVSRLRTRSTVKATAFSLTLLVVTGCSTSLIPAQSTQATKTQTARLNTAQVSQSSPSSQSSPKSQRFTTDRQNQLDDQGYSDGYGNGYSGSPASSNVGSANLTNPTEKNIYINAYNRGYAIGKAEQPSPSPLPTNTVSPSRRAELQQKGKQDGASDGQPGANLAANPDSGIAALGLTDRSEIQIYTDAYKSAYQQASRPKPVTVSRLNQLKQDAYNDGYADAQSNLPQDPNRSTTYPSLVNVTEQQAYTNSYNAGYQRYLTLVQPPPINGALW